MPGRTFHCTCYAIAEMMDAPISDLYHRDYEESACVGFPLSRTCFFQIMFLCFTKEESLDGHLKHIFFVSHISNVSLLKIEIHFK